MKVVKTDITFLIRGVQFYFVRLRRPSVFQWSTIRYFTMKVAGSITPMPGMVDSDPSAFCGGTLHVCL